MGNGLFTVIPPEFLLRNPHRKACHTLGRTPDKWEKYFLRNADSIHILK